MRLKLLVISSLVLSAFPLLVQAEESDFFAGLNVVGGTAFGSSDTADGGAPFAGGGIVDNVEFSSARGLAGHIGYRFDPQRSVFVSYQYTKSDISWDAHFPLFGLSSQFEGEAVTNTIMGNFAYEIPVANATNAVLTAGLGVTFNKLSDVDETDRPTGTYLARLANHSQSSVAAKVGVGLRHYISPTIVLGLDVSATYIGDFKTGDTRKGNLGVTDINPYEIDDVWLTSLGASIQFEV